MWSNWSRVLVAGFVGVACLGFVAAGAALRGVGAQSPDSTTKIECEMVVNASVEDVWRCWATDAGAQSFFAPKTKIEPFPGGAFDILFSPESPPGQRGAEDLHVLSVLPHEMISFEWSAPPQFAHARPQRTWVVVMLNAVDDTHTRVRLVHLGWDEMKAKNPAHAEEWEKVREYFSQAWPYVLNSLKRRFDEGPRWDGDGKLLWKQEGK
jgi:uncharacterized protein YndB with AHSA1/START domain